MDNKKGKTKIAVLSLVIVAVAVISVFAYFVMAEHTSSAELEPEWSAAGMHEEYVVDICNQGPDTVDEVRIYKNEKYTEFKCEKKTGWELLFINVSQACFYVSDPDTIPSGECDAFEFSAKVPKEGCNLEWEFETRDVKNAWKSIFDNTSVDDLPPVFDKFLEGPQYGDCPPGQGDCWITQSTEISFKVEEDEGGCGISGLEFCEITYRVNGGEPITEVHEELGGALTWEYNFSFKEDSEHELTLYCEDVAGNVLEDVEILLVETVPPDTTKVYEPEAFYKGWVEWISTDTIISLLAVDPEPHPSGVNSTWYQVIPVNNSWCEDPVENCKDFPEQRHTLYVNPFKIEESCHYIDFYSVDNLGNKEPIMKQGPVYGTGNWQCVFVDGTPPLLDKDNGDAIPDAGEPNFITPQNPTGAFHWLTQDMPITFTCTDQEPHPSDNEELCFKVAFDDPSWHYVTEQYCSGGLEDGWCCESATPAKPYDFNFMEDSMHHLEYYCRDAVKNNGDEHIQYYKVDSTPPSATKKMLGTWDGDCPPEDPQDECFVKGDGLSGVAITVEDGGEVCAVGNVSCYYEVWWEDQPGKPVETGYFTTYKEIFFHQGEDSEHELLVRCEDLLGNDIDDEETFLVDANTPETEKEYGEPTFVEGGYRWITNESKITLNATDVKVGVDETSYSVTLLAIPDEECVELCEEKGSGIFLPYTNPFTIGEDSCHLIEYYSTDLFGYEEIVNRQCVFVDNLLPVVSAGTGNPRIPCVAGEGCDYWISPETEITLNCYDKKPHPSGVDLIEFRWNLDGTGWTDWEEYSEPITFDEDSVHELGYRCTDNLGNMKVGPGKIYRVDATAPKATKTIVGPQFGECPPGEGDCYISTKTEIHMDAVDPDPTGYGCNVGNVTCEWKYRVNGGKWTEWSQILPIQFPGESEHELNIKCEDALGNYIEDIETFLVDDTPPETEKEYGEPYFEYGDSEWINNLTYINLSAEDPEPHPSGVNQSFYRFGLVDPKYCEDQEVCQNANISGDWTTYSTPFNIVEESCHLIEFYSDDMVENTEDVNKQCTYVDNTPPIPNKEVGEPKTKWNGSDNRAYPGIENRCWSQGPDRLECWIVTLLTPISMVCNDLDPHPVGNENVCFKVELDGDDTTKEYCDSYKGELNQEGYCCLETELDPFHFNELSEHNLTYYCEDALGNKGPLDEEIFKVELTAFEIQLNKKWNLISVPVSLLDDSMDEIFANLSDEVDAVYGYDAATGMWYIYTPDGNPYNDNLHTMLPGWGYWLYANEGANLTIGGSLLKPGQTIPSKNIVLGWNLIGYFGAEGQTGYYGPVGKGKPAECALYTIGDKWASLITYWEPDNPSVWHLLSQKDHMDPGAGYWLFYTDDEAIYTLTTINCTGW